MANGFSPDSDMLCRKENTEGLRWQGQDGCGCQGVALRHRVDPSVSSRQEESLDFCSDFQAVLHGCLVALGQIFSLSFKLMDCVCYSKNGLPQRCPFH